MVRLQEGLEPDGLEKSYQNYQSYRICCHPRSTSTCPDVRFLRVSYPLSIIEQIFEFVKGLEPETDEQEAKLLQDFDAWEAMQRPLAAFGAKGENVLC